MALEYELETTGATVVEVMRFFATQLDCEPVEPGFCHRDGLHLLGCAMDAEDIEPSQFLLSRNDTVSLTFRFLNNQPDAITHRNFTDMIDAALTYLDTHSHARSILTQDGERILLQRIKNEPLTFDSQWTDFSASTDTEALDRLATGHAQQWLLQPFLSLADLHTLRNAQA
jgi:hypothetical protein